MVAIEAVKRRAAGAWAPLVAGDIILIAEIGAARPLHDVATHRCHVPQLARCREQQAFGNERKPPTHLRVGDHVTHPSQRADAYAAIRQGLDSCHVRQAVDVQETLGQRRAILHQAKKVGTTGDEGQLRVQDVGRDRFRGIIGSRKRKRLHCSAPPGRFGNGVDDVGIASAATQIAAHSLANLRVRQIC